MFITRCQSYLGITLIEMMMSLLLGSIVVASLYSFVISNRYQLEKQVSLARENENAVAVSRLFQHEIKQAGHIGCMRLTDNAIKPYRRYLLTTSSKLQWVGANMLTVRYVQYPTATVVQTTTSSSIQVDHGDRFASNEILVITDCQHGEIFQAKYVSHTSQTQTITTMVSLQYQYQAGAEVGKLVENQFYVQGNSLYVKDIHGRSTEIAENMRKLQLRYVTVNDGQLVESSANEITDWSKVKGVDVEISKGRQLFTVIQ